MGTKKKKRKMWKSGIYANAADRFETLFSTDKAAQVIYKKLVAGKTTGMAAYKGIRKITLDLPKYKTFMGWCKNEGIKFPAHKKGTTKNTTTKTPINEKKVVREPQSKANIPGATISTFDGVRVLPDGSFIASSPDIAIELSKKLRGR